MASASGSLEETAINRDIFLPFSRSYTFPFCFFFLFSGDTMLLLDAPFTLSCLRLFISNAFFSFPGGAPYHPVSGEIRDVKEGPVFEYDLSRC